MPQWHVLAQSDFDVVDHNHHQHTSWASYQIRKIAGCACAGNAGNVFPRRRLQRKPLVSDPGMHHGTCMTHVPWCMSGSFNCGDGENVPGIPGACAPAILRIWQEAHCYEQTVWTVTVECFHSMRVLINTRFNQFLYLICRYLYHLLVKIWNDSRGNFIGDSYYLINSKLYDFL